MYYVYISFCLACKAIPIIGFPRVQCVCVGVCVCLYIYIYTCIHMYVCVICVSIHCTGVACTSLGPSFRVHRKVETQVPSVIDAYSLQSN